MPYVHLCGCADAGQSVLFERPARPRHREGEADPGGDTRKGIARLMRQAGLVVACIAAAGR
ncbi:hypothetical protein FF100_10215 [Methylobacterium terricola]|uniref:Uncharacterized protein n=1 Tax=Methylobacterium terricola TaxID=2583531 RepID=A0A5C4LMH9_9HYPH|nr:hypothetical protein FF100_10215 [Methylobacterium terricola]